MSVIGKYKQKQVKGRINKILPFFYLNLCNVKIVKLKKNKNGVNLSR